MNKYLKAGLKTLKVLAIVAGLFVGGIGLYVGYLAYESIEPFKVTDPSDPKFDPNKFEFDDYSGDMGILHAMRQIFYVGMPRDDVEKILLNGGARLKRIIFGISVIIKIGLGMYGET